MITLAYLSDWNYTDLPKRDAEKLTHISYSFARIKAGRASGAHWQNGGNAARELIRRYPEIKIGVSIGGWGADGFSQAMETAETRETLADSLVKIVEDYGFAGIDLDWEYPCSDVAGIAACPEDKDRFPLFVRLLREKLDSRRFITMAVGAGEHSAQNLLFPQMVDCLDYINLMTYDMGLPAGFSGHHTHLRAASDQDKNDVSAEQSVEIYHRHGVPMEKLVIGAAFYGKSCRVTERGGQNGLYMPQVPGSAGRFRYTDIAERLGRGARVYWDETAQAPYLYDEADGYFATFDDECSIKLKAQFAREHNMGGIMYWEYNDEKTGALLNAMYEGVKG